MFEWLEQEISAIKTPQFHVAEQISDAKLREALMKSSRHLPLAYKEFVLKFGNVKLYRNARNGSYTVGVFAEPREATLNDGTRIYRIGFHDGASVYIKPVAKSDRFPIFEFESELEEGVADSFEEWLSTSCTLARKRYGKKKWAEILRGPKPFSEEEKEIVEARKLIHWRLVGIDADGDSIFEVINAAQRSLAALTVGVRSKDGRLNGAVRLNVRNIAPGQTDRLHVNCYKNIVAPQDVELFNLPDPKPEDRDYYWEFER